MSLKKRAGRLVGTMSGLVARSVEAGPISLLPRDQRRKIAFPGELEDRTPGIEFFTLVLNGMPFIRYHLDTFEKLTLPWRWHIVEGVADLKYDTAWSVRLGGRIADEIHRNGLSNDGTSEYVDEIVRLYPDKVRVYRKPHGQFWNGKREMCNAVLQGIPEEALLWQVDVDEFWHSDQIEKLAEMFRQDPTRTAARFHCRFFVGPRLVVTSRGVYGNNPAIEWFRVWRYRPGMVWLAHEPPRLALRTRIGAIDVGQINPFTHQETEAHDLVFEHYAYVVPAQLRFKEIYYGYGDALSRWAHLQERNDFPVFLRDYFPWVRDDAMVDVCQPRFPDVGILEHR